MTRCRGAGGSGGKTSWTARPEQQDYISFIGFLAHYLHDLEPNMSLASTSPKSPDAKSLSPPVSPEIPKQAQKSTLLLGGYSYGSLIVTQLLDLATIMSSNPDKGSAAAEVRLRAAHLAAERNHKIQQLKPRGRKLTVQDPASPATVYGGDECEPGTRRVSREARRSIDVVRQSVEASKARLHLRRHDSSDHSNPRSPDEKLEEVIIPQPKLRFLLVSPLLPPISSFLAMFGRSWKATGSSMPKAAKVSDNLQQHPTLAVYGDSDFFTSHTSLEKWSRGLASKPESRFIGKNVPGAGHFWQEEGALDQLRQKMVEWLLSIDSEAEP